MPSSAVASRTSRASVSGGKPSGSDLRRDRERDVADVGAGLDEPGHRPAAAELAVVGVRGEHEHALRGLRARAIPIRCRNNLTLSSADPHAMRHGDTAQTRSHRRRRRRRSSCSSRPPRRPARRPGAPRARRGRLRARARPADDPDRLLRRNAPAWRSSPRRRRRPSRSPAVLVRRARVDARRAPRRRRRSACR